MILGEYDLDDSLSTDLSPSLHSIDSIEDLYKCPLCFVIWEQRSELANHIVSDSV